MKRFVFLSCTNGMIGIQSLEIYELYLYLRYPQTRSGGKHPIPFIDRSGNHWIRLCKGPPSGLHSASDKHAHPLPGTATSTTSRVAKWPLHRALLNRVAVKLARCCLGKQRTTSEIMDALLAVRQVSKLRCAKNYGPLSKQHFVRTVRNQSRDSSSII
jgi:hypothetical protein